MPPEKPARGKLSLIVFSGDHARVHYALAAAAAAAAIDRPTTLFFTMEASRALFAPGVDGAPGWRALAGAEADAELRARGVAGFDELLESCVELGVHFMVCEMGLRALGAPASALRADIPVATGGLASFCRQAEGGATLFV